MAGFYSNMANISGKRTPCTVDRELGNPDDCHEFSKFCQNNWRKFQHFPRQLLLPKFWNEMVKNSKYCHFFDS